VVGEGKQITAPKPKQYGDNMANAVKRIANKKGTPGHKSWKEKLDAAWKRRRELGLVPQKRAKNPDAKPQAGK